MLILEGHEITVKHVNKFPVIFAETEITIFQIDVSGCILKTNTGDYRGLDAFRKLAKIARKNNRRVLTIKIYGIQCEQRSEYLKAADIHI